jgi:hypothetical protein
LNLVSTLRLTHRFLRTCLAVTPAPGDDSSQMDTSEPPASDTIKEQTTTALAETTQTAAATALAAAAVKSKHLSSVEERRVKGLVAQVSVPLDISTLDRAHLGSC